MLQTEQYPMLNTQDTLHRKTSCRHNKLNDIILRQCGKETTKYTKLIIHSTTATVALKFGSEAWVLKIGDEQILEASQVRFLRHTLGSTKLGGEFGTNCMCRTLFGDQRSIDEGGYSGHKKALQYQPSGRRNKGRLRKR